MMPDLIVAIDTSTGDLLVDAPSSFPDRLRNGLEALAGEAREIVCAAPIALQTLAPASKDEGLVDACIRIVGYWHGSLIEGPGRRSVVKIQGCPIRCQGCITPDSWDATGGMLVPVDRVADALLDPSFERDGVTILGGEPFAQPDGLLALVEALRARACDHIVCYSGFTYGELRRRVQQSPAIGRVLDEIDMLIDGPFVAGLADGAGPWTGSANQRVLTLKTLIGRSGVAA
ncbi:MAG: radical SAM protein [Chloroflexi bacterium]|nr:radical SAM protein [Chloroflexota bacterium]